MMRTERRARCEPRSRDLAQHVVPSGAAAAAYGDRRVGARVQKRGDDRLVALARGPREGGAALVVGRVQVGARLQQQVDHRRAAAQRRIVQRHEPVGARRVRALRRHVRQQERDAVRVAAEGGGVQRPPPVLVLRRRRRAVAQQQARRLRVLL
eukprot:2559096-Prymnesium_polylepis.1